MRIEQKSKDVSYADFSSKERTCLPSEQEKRPWTNVSSPFLLFFFFFVFLFFSGGERFFVVYVVSVLCHENTVMIVCYTLIAT